MSIAETIRRAALSWPLGFVGDVESVILHTAFMDHIESALWVLFGRASVQGRTYMLLIAEALE